MPSAGSSGRDSRVSVEFRPQAAAEYRPGEAWEVLVEEEALQMLVEKAGAEGAGADDPVIG